MGQLIYSMIVSLDGYVADQQGNFDWGEPAEEVLAAVNEDLHDVGTFLYGRRMYEVMQVWETDPDLAGDSPGSQAFARLWQRATKVVYSTTMTEVTTSQTELHHTFEPVHVAQLKEHSQANLTITGPTLAAEAFRHNLVDQVHLFVCPLVLGGGLSFFPTRRLHLELTYERRFTQGMVQLQYAVNHAG